MKRDLTFLVRMRRDDDHAMRCDEIEDIDLLIGIIA